MMCKLYLDDERTPKTEGFRVVRTVVEAQNWCQFRCPRYISFDHDLGENQPTGYDFARWLVDKDLGSGGQYIPDDFEFNVHSANPVGAQNIVGLLSGYLSWRNS